MERVNLKLYKKNITDSKCCKSKGRGPSLDLGRGPGGDFKVETCRLGGVRQVKHRRKGLRGAQVVAGGTGTEALRRLVSLATC